VCECHIEIKGYLLTYLLTYPQLGTEGFCWSNVLLTAWPPCWRSTFGYLHRLHIV